MKIIKLLIALIIGCTISMQAQSNDPFIIMETTGKIKVTPTKGKSFRAEAGSYLYANNTLTLNDGSKALVYNGDATFWLEGPGNVVLSKELLEKQKFSIRSFDPIFGDYTRASLEMLVDARDYGGWDISTSKKGDGWGAKSKKDKGGWGADAKTNPADWGSGDKKDKGGWGSGDKKDKGGWGSKDKKTRGGWEANPVQSVSGWGVVAPSGADWGSGDKKDKGGWGSKNKKDAGGWGAKINTAEDWGSGDKKDKGGWGSKNKKDQGGWGKDDPRAKGKWGWGSKNKKDKGGWGVEHLTTEPATPGGFYLAKKSKIKWIKEKDVKRYLFTIVDTFGTLIHSEIAKDKYVYDFSQLEKGKLYFWQVVADGKKAASPPTEFKVIDRDVYNKSLAKCRKSKIYQSAGTAVKLMMESLACETNGLYLQANEMYEAISKQHNKNDLVKANYAAFCLRMGQFDKAKDIATKI